MKYATYDDMVSHLANICAGLDMASGERDAAPVTLLLQIRLRPCPECFSDERDLRAGEPCEACQDTGIGLEGEDVTNIYKEQHEALVAALEDCLKAMAAWGAGQGGIPNDPSAITNPWASFGMGTTALLRAKSGDRVHQEAAT